ncbi:MAG: hypothetical protein GC192_19925 [Bacteroidetes bacterium]|nr:hypothetical protein [Bacteroidota bacterium]
MKYFFSLAISCFFMIQIGHTQLGLSIGTKTLNSKCWDINESKLNADPYPKENLAICIDYHLFGAKKRRIEFYPEFSFSKYSFNKDPLDSISYEYVKFVHLQNSFQFNTRIYLLDINCDYRCDSISTIGSFFKKGLFVEVAPILVYKNNIHYHFISKDRNLFKGSKSSFSAGISFGAGMDLYFSKRLIFTPFLRLCYLSKYCKWANPNIQVYNSHSNLKQFFVGCRFGIEF